MHNAECIMKPKPTKKERTTMNPQTNKDSNPIRELMLAVEYLRSACEHSEGKTQDDRERLAKAMSVGIRINAKYAHLLPDYQQETFWREVKALPDSFLVFSSSRPGAGKTTLAEMAIAPLTPLPRFSYTRPVKPNS